MTTTIDDTPTHAEDAYEPEEDTNLDVVLRRRMGFRPIHIHDDGPHPDRRPCPTWCWVGQTGGEYDHEVDPKHPMSAMHVLGSTPAVMATLYEGESARADLDRRFVRTATIESRLEQLGQGAPVVHVDLRRWKGSKQHLDEVLKLTLDDAREFMTALGYVVEVATA